MSLTERGIGVSSYNPMQMVARRSHTVRLTSVIFCWMLRTKPFWQGWEDAPETYEQWTRKGQRCLILKLPIVWVWGLACSVSGA